MNLLVGVSAPDEDTFVIEMSEPYYPMLTELACIRPFAMISPNCMIDGSTMNGVNGYIGTGPMCSRTLSLTSTPFLSATRISWVSARNSEDHRQGHPRQPDAHYGPGE